MIEEGLALIEQGDLDAEGFVALIRRATDRRLRLGELAVAMGALSPEEVEQVLALQRAQGGRFGELAMALGLADADTIVRLLGVQVAHAPTVAELLAEAGRP